MASPVDEMIIPDVHYVEYGNLTDKVDVAMAGFELPRMGNMLTSVDGMDKIVRLGSVIKQAVGKDVDLKVVFKPDGDSKPYAEVYIKNRGWNPEESEPGESLASKAMKERLKAIVKLIQLTVVDIVHLDWMTARLDSLEQLNQEYCTDLRAGSGNEPALGNDIRAEGGYVESAEFKKLKPRDIQQEPQSDTEAGERKKDAGKFKKRKEDEMPDAFSSENVVKRSKLIPPDPLISDRELDGVVGMSMSRAAETFNNFSQQQADNGQGSEGTEDSNDKKRESRSPAITSGFSAPSSACYSQTSPMGGSPKSPPNTPDSKQYPESPLIKEDRALIGQASSLTPLPPTSANDSDED